MIEYSNLSEKEIRHSVFTEVPTSQENISIFSDSFLLFKSGIINDFSIDEQTKLLNTNDDCDPQDLLHLKSIFLNTSGNNNNTSEILFNNESQTSNNKSINSSLRKGKRGRIKQKRNERPTHNKYAQDNIKRKIQVHYLKFLRNFINRIIYEISYKDKNIKNFQFYPLNYKFTKKISNNSFNTLKKAKIGDIFKYNVSPKYKNYQYLNLTVYNEVSKNIIIKKILDKKYLDFFNIYYSGEKTFYLKHYYADIKINLPSNLGYFQDLIEGENNKINCIKNEEIYRTNIKKCIEKNFINKPIFVVNKYPKNRLCKNF